MATNECNFVDINGTTIDYKQSGNNLMRNSDTLEVGLASPPNGLIFTYVNAYGQSVLTKTLVKSVRVKLSLANAPLNVTFESSARIRNN
jgi:hypothetical protein